MGDPCIVAASLATPSPTGMWKENIANELVLAEEISKLCVHLPPGFFLLFIIKCERRRTGSRKNHYALKEPGLDSLEIFQPLRMANNAKIKKCLPGMPGWLSR